MQDRQRAHAYRSRRAADKAEQYGTYRPVVVAL